MENSFVGTAISILNIIVIIIFPFLAIYIKRKIEKDLQYKYDKKLSAIKGDIELNKQKFASLSSAISPIVKIKYEKELVANEELWKCILKIRDHASTVSFFYDMRLKEELNSFTRFEEISYIQDINNMDILKDSQIESYKIYYKDSVWLLFFIYRAFLLRLVVLLQNSITNKSIVLWKEDIGIISLLKEVLSEEELSKILSLKISSVNILTNLLEYKIINEIKVNILGTESIENVFDISKKYVELNLTTDKQDKE